jgi:hypothetical protein
MVNFWELRESPYKSLCNSSEVQRLGFVNEPVNPILVGGERGYPTRLKRNVLLVFSFWKILILFGVLVRRVLRAKFPEEVTPFQQYHYNINDRLALL